MTHKQLNISIKITLILLAITVALIIYISNFKSVVFDIEHYSNQYSQLEIQSLFDDDTDLITETQLLIDYLKHDTDQINSSFYNTKETAHMIEVRNLFDGLFRILDFCVILSVLLTIGFMFLVRQSELKLSIEEGNKRFKELLSHLLTWTGYSVLIIGGLFVLIALTFDYSFIWFHQIFFETNTWMMNSEVDNMVRMLPFNFFLNTFIKIILMSVFFAAIIFVAGLVVGKDWNKNMNLSHLYHRKNKKYKR